MMLPFQSGDRHSSFSTTAHLYATLPATAPSTSLSTEYGTMSPLDSAVASIALPFTKYGCLQWADSRKLYVRAEKVYVGVLGGVGVGQVVDT